VLSAAALADPTRRQIVEMLAAGELSSGQIAGRFNISSPAISQHLKVLKQASFVQCRVEAQRRIYALDRAGFAELEHWLAGFTQFWQSRLDRLEGELRKTDGSKPKSQRRSRKGTRHER